MRRHAAFHFGLFHLVILALGLGTVSGWAAFFIASRSFAETERELRGQVSSLHQIQMDLLRENDRVKAAAGDLEPLQSQLETLRQEANLLTQARDLARAELVTAATGMRNLVDQLNQARSDVAETQLPIGHRGPGCADPAAPDAQATSRAMTGSVDRL